jgi:hypothetical protein
MNAKLSAMKILSEREPEEDEGPAEAPKLSSLMEELADALRAKDYDGAAKAFSAAMSCGGESEEL